MQSIFYTKLLCIMRVILDILDSRAVFMMELLHSFSYVKVQPVTDVNALFLNDKESNIAQNLSIQNRKKPSDYFGTLNVEEGEKFKEYLNNSRLEWERKF